jgi:hypothetical protein
MPSNNQSQSGGGVGAAGLLGALFVGLKLGHVIDWSWWWVTAPFWGGVALVVALLVGGGLVISAIEWRKAAKRRKEIEQARNAPAGPRTTIAERRRRQM